MKVVITGGTGFVGFRLAKRILELGKLTGPDGQAHEIDSMLLFDNVIPDLGPLDERVEVRAGDIADPAKTARLIDRDDISVFHLASVVSGGGEKDFDLAMRVNLDGSRAVFEACRKRGSTPRMVFASTLATFGGSAMPKTVGDTTKQVPQTTYGMTKAACELMINDYTRKGFFDGRSARLPTVIIRPGKPNLALSGFASGIFREPLNGIDYVCAAGLETRMPVISVRMAVEGFIALHEAPGDAIGEDRAVGLPSLSVTVAEMIDSLQRVAGDRPLGAIKVEPDPLVESVCSTWPFYTDNSRATSLGLPLDESLDDIVRGYIEDYL
ncbi:MAG: NAD-dependent epimerase [Rhodospirillaceae bacterium]|nr:NAD-dependent epimerase [Rhodospirillaceae bacterium]